MNSARSSTALPSAAIPPTGPNDADPLDLIWGCAGIGEYIGKSPKAAFYMCETGKLPGVKQIGRQWVASRRKLREHFEGAGA